METTRREKERAHRRELLLEAAERVFGSRPFDLATMQDVVAEAQIGMQGLYAHFPSKQALYEELLVHRAEGFGRKSEAATSGISDPVDQLRALAICWTESFDERPMFLPIFLQERVRYDWGFESRFSHRIGEIYSAERERLVGILIAAVERRQVRPLPAAFLAQQFFEVATASVHYHHTHPGEGVLACVERIMTAFLVGVQQGT